MKKVNINKSELLSIVETNRKKHINEYNENIEEYKSAASRLANEHVSLALSGDLAKIAKIKAMPAPPVSHEKDYDKAIQMLELSVDFNIELDKEDFERLVLDEWTWKTSFIASGALYKAI